MHQAEVLPSTPCRKTGRSGQAVGLPKPWPGPRGDIVIYALTEYRSGC